jgi:phage terminase small subunit
MRRKVKATTIEGAVKAIRDVSAPPLACPYWLTEAQKPVWDEIISRRSRDEWNAIDLRFAWELAEVMIRLHEEKKALANEGSIIFGQAGAKQNPRNQVVQTLSRQAIWLATYLRVNPSSDASHAQLVAGPRKAEKEARLIAAGTDPDLLPVQ